MGLVAILGHCCYSERDASRAIKQAQWPYWGGCEIGVVAKFGHGCYTERDASRAIKQARLPYWGGCHIRVGLLQGA